MTKHANIIARYEISAPRKIIQNSPLKERPSIRTTAYGHRTVGLFATFRKLKK